MRALKSRTKSLTIRIGSRGSRLALEQANQVAKKLTSTLHGATVEIVAFRTAGDRTKGIIPEVGDKGLFTRDIENALLQGRVDIAVHSAKDLTSQLPRGLSVAAVLGGGESREAFVSSRFARLTDLSEGARVGTSSLRRRAQLLRRLPFVKVVAMRGNVDTRLRKLQAGAVDALLLSYMGLLRLGLEASAREILSEEEFLPAPCQGLVACEVKSASGARHLVREITEHESEVRFRAERAFVARLESGCRLPVGVSTKIAGDQLVMTGAVFSSDGEKSVSWTLSGKASRPEEAGRELAESLLSAGGGELLLDAQKMGTVS